MKTAILFLLCFAVCGFVYGVSIRQPVRVQNKTETIQETLWNDPDSYSFVYDFETTNQTQTLDTSGKNNNASNMPSVATGPTWNIYGTNMYGRIEHGYYFDHGDDYFAATNQSLSSTTMTATCWVFLSDNLVVDYALFGQWPGGGVGNWLIYFGQDLSNKKISALIKQSDGTTISSPASDEMKYGQWTHIAMIADGSKLHLYTNAVECGSGTSYDGTILNTARPVNVGCLSSGDYQMWGSLDGCSYSPYPRSVVNITNEYKYTHPTNNIKYR